MYPKTTVVRACMLINHNDNGKVGSGKGLRTSLCIQQPLPLTTSPCNKSKRLLLTATATCFSFLFTRVSYKGNVWGSDSNCLFFI
jgi:hypothetical protein